MASTVPDQVQWKLECPTCQEIFKNPVTLKCGHSFCLKCLNDYVRANPTAVTRQILPCSVCRHETTVPHPEEPVEDWGKQLTPSFTIRKLAEQTEGTPSTSNSYGHRFVCLGHGKTTPAVWWCPECEISLCQRCARTHQLTPVSEAHNIIGVKEKSKITKLFKMLCPEHRELITFHCRDCKKSGCSSCCTLQHRKCGDIAPIQSMFGEMKSSLAGSHQTVLERLQDKEIELTVLKSQLEFVESKQDATLSKIVDVEKRMMILLQEKYQKDKDEVRKAAEVEKFALQAAIKTAQLDIEMYRQHVAVLSQVLESRDEADILKMHEFCQSGSLTEDARDSRERDHVTDLDFYLCEYSVQHLLSDLGHVAVTKMEGMLYRPRFVKQVDTRTEEDESSPRLTDITFLTVRDVDAFIVTDRLNNSVKCFYSRKNASTPSTSPRISHSVCQLEKKPWAITKFGENKVIVSVPSMCRLVTLCVTPDLVKDTATRTQKGYDSLCTLNSGLVAAGHRESVDLLSVSSDTVTRIGCFTHHTLFTSPWYLTSNVHENGIIVSDNIKHRVTCLTSKGNIKWTYASPPETSFNPQGVTTTRRGDVVVVDGQKIIVLSRSGVHKTDLLTPADSDICDPVSVHCDDRGYLYVAGRTGRVLIYRLTEI